MHLPAWKRAPAWTRWGQAGVLTPPGLSCMVVIHTEREMVPRLRHRETGMATQYIGDSVKRFEAVGGTYAELLAALPEHVREDGTAYGRAGQRVVEDYVAAAERRWRATRPDSDTPVTDRQVDYLVSLLRGADDDQRATVANLVGPDGVVDLPAVRSLSRRAASQVIDQLKSGR